MHVIDLPIAELRRAEYNPRVISKRELANLRRSIRRFGLVEPVVVRRADRLVIGGHQRLRAAELEGLVTAPCVELDLTDDEAKLLNLALNRITGTWDVPRLGELLADLSLRGARLELSGFDHDEVSRLVGVLRERDSDPPEAPPAEPSTDACPHCGARLTR